MDRFGTRITKLNETLRSKIAFAAILAEVSDWHDS
jgi:hypothetical protein